MAMEYKNGKILVSIQVIGKMIEQMVEVNYIMHLVIYMKENGKMIKHMVKVYIFIKMEVDMMVNGKMICSMVMVQKYGQINPVLLDIILKDKNMVKEKYNFVMVLHMKVIQSIMKLKVMVCINGLTESNMKDNGKIIK